MGRGRMGSSGGGSSRGSMGSSGRSSFGGGRSHSHTTVFIGGRRHHHHHGGGFTVSGSPIVGIIVGAIFALVGLFTFFGGFAQLFKYGSVDATCVLNEKSYGYYYSTYEYTIDGKDYRNRSEQSWEFEEDVGKVVTIYYAKSDPNLIYEVKPTSTGESLVIMFAGLAFGGFGSIPMILCIKELKGRKAGDGDDASTAPVTEETHTRCHYCGAKFNKKSDSCPKCGAGKYE